MTRARSRYDELHDRFDPIKTKKAGTRYERLTAMVLKALNDRDVVIHDARLLGDSDVKHQIDVRIQQDGIDRQIIVECKDFDLAGDKVGLDIVRSFRSVVEDTEADEAIIVTCNDFTEDARKYAKAKGIKLAILRTFEPSDMEGRIQKIVHTITIRGAVAVDVEQLAFSDAGAQAGFARELAANGIGEVFRSDDPVFLVKGGERIQFNHFLTQAANADADAKGHLAGEWKMQLPADGWQLSVGTGLGIDFAGIVLRYTLVDESEVSEIVSDRIAELILTDLGTADMIVFADQLERHQIGSDGEVL